MSYRRTHYEIEVRLYGTPGLDDQVEYVAERVGKFARMPEAAQEVIKLAEAIERGESLDSSTFEQLMEQLGFTTMLEFHKIEILVVGVTVQWFDGQAVTAKPLSKAEE